MSANSEFIATLINDCGTAFGLATTAAFVLGEYRRLGDAGLLDAYIELSSVVLKYASVSETEFTPEEIQEAIDRFGIE